ncbi:DUF971 domain-containing protein [uncultured Abyssibacter sp.]|uniref:DUF971 domain-containing protein n=1 Tax=uncultured Abyssibacter sp. TaxID=2320202 RepID=UPI0032B2B37E
MIPVPTKLTLHRASRVLDVTYDDGSTYSIPAELMRVYSPSAEVKGHGPGQEKLVWGKRSVGIEHIEAVGSYAIRPVFDDGHDSGLYGWQLLHEFCMNQDALWQNYLARLDAAGVGRDPGVRTLDSVVKQYNPNAGKA